MHVYPSYYKKVLSFKYKIIFLSGKYKNDKPIVWRIKINSTG